MNSRPFVIDWVDKRMEFPKLKKELRDFVSNEDGQISQKSLITLGIVSIGALGGVASVHAATGTSGDVEWSTGTSCNEIVITCKDTVEGGGDVQLVIKPLTQNFEVDMGIEGMTIGDDCGDANSNVRNWLAEQWQNGNVNAENYYVKEWYNNNPSMYPTKITFGSGSGAGGDEGKPIVFHQHSNSLDMLNVESVLTGKHDHSITAGCDVEIGMSIWLDCDAKVAKGKFTIFKDGTQLTSCIRQQNK